MKTPRNLGLAAIVVFLIAFFLPATSGDSGFACFGYCWNIFWGHDDFAGGNAPRILSGGWLYYSGFVISNILFIGLAAALSATRQIRKLRSVISVVCFLQVLSWLVLNVISGTPSQITSTINVGYYVWLLAYGLLVAAHLWKMAPSNNVTGANSHPASPSEPHCPERRAAVTERRWRYHGVAAVAQSCR